MKRRILCIILAVVFLMSGCSISGKRVNQSVTFHYLCSEYPSELCCVIASEEREATGHMGNLSYLIALYLMGPTTDEYAMPLPAGTKISAQYNDGHVLLELSNMAQAMSDLDFSLACACLSMTCMEIVEAEDVTIRCVDREKVITRNSLTLNDITSETTPATEDTP